MKNRIEQKMEQLESRQEKAFITYMTAGLPDFAGCKELIRTQEKAGTDILELGIPFGAYVEEFDMDSPAMRAGIQRGDVIVAVGERNVSNYMEYSNALMNHEPGETVEVTVKRQAQEEYREMKFEIELGGVR